MFWWQIPLITAVSYLLGSVNGSLLVSHTFLKVDIRDYGSGNAGTTNALRVMGKKWAILVTVIDLLKGALAVLFGYWLLQAAGAASLGKLLAGVFTIAGHIFPVFFRFKGGKGVMTTLAVIIFVDWRVALICLSAFILVVLITRWVSLGSILATAGVPAGMYLFHMGEGGEAAVLTGLSAVITLMIIIMHRENIGRILAGTERRFSFKGRAALDKLSAVKAKTADITHKTAGAIRKTSKRLRDGASGLKARRKNRKISKRRLRKARKTGRMSRLGRRPKRKKSRGPVRHTA